MCNFFAANIARRANVSHLRNFAPIVAIYMIKKKTNKEIVVHVRISKGEHQQLIDSAKDAGLSVSSYIRARIANKKMYYRLRPSELTILADVVHLRNIITWLNNAYKNNNFDEVKKSNIMLISRLNEIIDKFKD